MIPQLWLRIMTLSRMELLLVSYMGFGRRKDCKILWRSVHSCLECLDEKKLENLQGLLFEAIVVEWDGF